jgi:DNA-binding IclR family transcriptional regulator
MRKEARGIQSIEVSGRILRALVETCKPMMLKDLAHAADLAPAQCHAYLTSLRNVGLIHQDQHSGHYKTGRFAMRLGIGWLKTSPLASAAIHELKTLTDELRAMSLISVWGVSGPTIVHINSGLTPTALNLRQGSLFSVTGTATGLVFAAFGNAHDIESHVAAELDSPGRARSLGAAPTREEFDAQVAVTRANGYSTAKATPIPDINAVAAPIFEPDGSLAFVATLIGPIDELSVEDDAVAVDRLLAVTRKISQDASHTGGNGSSVAG